MKVDKAGNLFATGPGGVWVFAREGTPLGTIQPPEITANVGCGDDGRTLFPDIPRVSGGRVPSPALDPNVSARVSGSVSDASRQAVSTPAAWPRQSRKRPR